ncbi:MAG: ABC transporter ATP-binding protein [Candidatus Ranarchaeia archaeon]
MTLSDAMIKVSDLNKEYKRGREIVHALKNINLQIKEGQFFVIVGPSGCGKTTLLNIMSGLDRPTSGRVILDGMDITDANLDESILPVLRREKIGFIFQDFNLIRNMSALENVTSPLWPMDMRGKEIQEKGMELIRAVDLVERKDHKPKQLSGGEQQRVAIARALITSPKVVFADEPTGNLDTKTGQAIMQLLRNINKSKNITFVIVTHDDSLIKFADRVATMRDGRIIKEGKS